MKILLRQFLGKNHSWSVVGWGIAESLISKGHDVDLFSTDGDEHIPDQLRKNLIGYCKEFDSKNIVGKFPDKNYEACISYTAMLNFSSYLQHSRKNRFGIWCYEWAGKNVLPNAFAKQYKNVDKILAPSNYAKDIFVDSGIPNSSISVIPHGINTKLYSGDSKIQLSDKKFKLFSNIAQNHIRKNIPGLLEAFGKAFTKDDDVCLIIKAKEKPLKNHFDVSLNNCLNDFYKKFPNHAEIRFLKDFYVDMSEIYRSIDCVYNLPNTECFFFPGLEGIASGKMVIAPNYGGQLDFLNEQNALLVSGKETRANPKSMYWQSKTNAMWFEPSIEDAVIKLQFAYKNFQDINKKVEENRKNILDRYNWDNVTKQILDLT